MKLIHYINKSINIYPILYSYHNFFSSQIRVLDQIFGTIGNGLEWAKTVRPTDGGYMCKPSFKEENEEGEYIRNFDAPYGKKTYKEPPVLSQVNILFPYAILQGWQPYPSFDKEFSPLWKTEFMQEDWRMGALLWLGECNNYFNDPEKIIKYSYYPNERHNKSLKDNVIKLMPKNTIEQINKDYGTTCFNGNNFEEFAQERWMNTLNDTLNFIKETTTRLISM
jgi:hypothetical protein